VEGLVANGVARLREEVEIPAKTEPAWVEKCPICVQFQAPWGVSIRKNVALCFQWVGPDSNRRSVD
jgi:hypothetical protein